MPSDPRRGGARRPSATTLKASTEEAKRVTDPEDARNVRDEDLQDDSFSGEGSQGLAPGLRPRSGGADGAPEETAPAGEPVLDGRPGTGTPGASDGEGRANDVEPPLSEGEAPREGRRSRLRWKKKEMPEGLWLKCESCSQMIYRKELEEKGMVCPACEFHFTLPGRDRVAMVIDPGTWHERFAELSALDRLDFKDQVPYGEKVRRAVQRSGQNEALISGTGSVLGRPVVLAVLDFSFMGGSMGEVVGEKVSLAADLARTRREPLLVFTSSGGARMHEGMLSLMQMAKTSAALATLNEQGGFSVCVLTNPTTGGVTASFASVCDVTLAEPGALVGFAGPRVIATTLKQELPPGFQRAEFLVEKGQIDRIVSREELRDVLARLIDFGRRAWSAPRRPPTRR